MNIETLTDILSAAAIRRAVNNTTMAALLEFARRPNYATISVLEDIQRIEDDLESEGVFDLLLMLRSYLVMDLCLSARKDWWEVVDLFAQSTSVVDMSKTVNRVEKGEYYRLVTPATRAFNMQYEMIAGRDDRKDDPFRANDWLVVLWLLSFLSLDILADLPAAPKAKDPVN